jgi:carbohydrate kinase (thermoresistant glucokinase family)
MPGYKFMLYVLMGVAGSGKTAVGNALAKQLGLHFYDADDFHPKVNIEKMAAGIPLQDEDRWPWLDTLAYKMVTWQQQGGAVLACSALKQSYRRRLTQKVGKGEVCFIHLVADFDTLQSRLELRRGHFFPASLLKTQLDSLEPPKSGLTINTADSIENIVESIIQQGVCV